MPAHYSQSRMMARYLSPEHLLHQYPWRPPESDFAPYEDAPWTCPECGKPRLFSAYLVRLEATPKRLLVQCPHCDHLAVLRIQELPTLELQTEYAGPHVGVFTAYLDERGRKN